MYGFELVQSPLCCSTAEHMFQPHALFGVTTAPPTGRISNVLSSTGPITIVVPSRSPSPELSAALRIAHNLNVYHKLDTVIVDDHEAALAVRDGSLASGNFVVLSQGKLGGFAASLVSKSATPFGVDGSILRLRSRSFTAPSTGVLFLHPHPTNAEALTLFVYGTDESGLERALRLFPVRTGVTVPDWIVVGPQADARGTGGVQSAGYVGVIRTDFILHPADIHRCYIGSGVTTGGGTRPCPHSRLRQEVCMG